MKRFVLLPPPQAGFTVVDTLVGIVIFGIIVIGLTSGLNNVRQLYGQARQLNEIYTVLSACPELDRALDYNVLSSTSNCYPNNSFPAEDGGPATITYSPSLNVTATSALPTTDPLYNIPDSKVVDITVGFQRPYTSLPNLELKMLISRNGIAQS